MLSLPNEESEVFFRDWRVLAQDYLLVGKISRAPGSQLVQVQYELFDINRELKLAGEILTGSVTQLRDIGHEISNVVFELRYCPRLHHPDTLHRVGAVCGRSNGLPSRKSGLRRSACSGAARIQ